MAEVQRVASFNRVLFSLLLLSLVSNIAFSIALRIHISGEVTAPNHTKVDRQLSPTQVKELQSQDAPSLGPINAPVTLVVFSDFRCPFCRGFADTLRKLEASDPSKFRVVMRQLPLTIHDQARAESELASCTAAQSVPAFWELYWYLYDGPIGKGDRVETSIRFLTTRYDIDTKALRACMSDHTGWKLVDRDVRLANKYEVASTPTIFVDGVRLVGEARSPDKLLLLIRSKARENTKR